MAKQYKQWEQTSSLLIRSLPSREFHAGLQPGSWEYAVATITNDAVYQAALYTLTHWLEFGKKLRDLKALDRYVTGLQLATALLEQVGDTIGDVEDDGKQLLSYPVYDFEKNAALAAMQAYTAVDALDTARLRSIGGRAPNRSAMLSSALRRVERALSKMRMKGDPDAPVFEGFLHKFGVDSIDHPHAKASIESGDTTP